jgi:hypothetical protein
MEQGKTPLQLHRQESPTPDTNGRAWTMFGATCCIVYLAFVQWFESCILQIPRGIRKGVIILAMAGLLPLSLDD